jgi:hypothetical protein
MPLGDFVDAASPYQRVAIALIPFLVALVARLLFGKNRVTRVALSVAPVWFAANVIMAPYSVEMRRELLNFGTRLQ